MRRRLGRKYHATFFSSHHAQSNPVGFLCKNCVHRVGTAESWSAQRVLARELGISSLHYIYPNTQRGFVSAFYGYSVNRGETWRVLWRERPWVVLCHKSPAQSSAVLCVFAYARSTGAQYVIDAHSAAFQHWFWTCPRWLFRLLAGMSGDNAPESNPHFKKIVNASGGHALVLRDIPTSLLKSRIIRCRACSRLSWSTPLRRMNR